MPPRIDHHTSLARIAAGHEIFSAAFAPSGELLVTGGQPGVRVWRVKDGVQTTKLKTQEAYCVTVSNDNKWITAGTGSGQVLLWNAETFETIFAHKSPDSEPVTGVDFSPDSRRLAAASWNRTVTVWAIPTGEKLLRLCHDDRVKASRYSIQGDQIATATRRFVRVWNSNDGTLLTCMNVYVAGLYNTGLLWSTRDCCLFVICSNKIKEIDPFSKSTVSEWIVADNINASACIALAQHGEFIAYSAKDAVTFWDTTTHTQLYRIQQNHKIVSVVLSPHNRLFATASREGNIVLGHLHHTPEDVHPISENPSTQELSIFPRPQRCAFQGLEIHIDDDVLCSWKDGQLEHAETLLTAAIQRSHSLSEDLFASRALIRARLERWDAAIIDANESIKVSRSVLGYIAKFVVLAGQGKAVQGLQVCDIAFEYFRSAHITILLLIKAVVLFMTGEHEDALTRVEDLILATDFGETLQVIQTYMYLRLGNSQVDKGDYESAIKSFKRARTQLPEPIVTPPVVISLISGWSFDDLALTVQRRLCEALRLGGHIEDAGEAILEIVNMFPEEIQLVTEWVIDFMQQCLSTLRNGEDATATDHQDVESYHLVPSAMLLLREWAKFKLASSSWEDALASAVGFVFPKCMIYQAMCEHLEATGDVMNAIASFNRMNSELALDIEDEQARWMTNFISRCLGMLEELGDSAMNAGRYDEAITYYTSALPLNHAIRHDILVRRSRAYVGNGLWEEALRDANEVVELDPSSPLGYERMNAALHGAGRYDEAVDALETMLWTMSQSPDPDIRDRSRLYVWPAKTRDTIRVKAKRAVSDLPLLLINTHSGRLLDKSRQASAFEFQPIFRELLSSMITDVDDARIDREVAQYYCYATFSCVLEDDDPLFDKVTQMGVYDLEESPTHHVLQMFCKTVRNAGLHWAWCDTCCVNRRDRPVLERSLVSMYKWYEGSAMTVVFLPDVHERSRRGALTKSIWNTSIWSLLKYHASKVVQFYTKDWTPYLGLSVSNHKESPEIVSEMEEAIGMSASTMMALQPGMDNIRDKLRLASMRQAECVEDAAYLLLGLFSLSLPIGDRSIGRLLAELITNSGETSVLAWTGQSGSFNSCLPASIGVFNQPPTTHVPPRLMGIELQITITGLRASSLDMNLAIELYDRMSVLPPPSFSGRRLRLACLMFQLGPLLASTRHGPQCIFRAQTTALGAVEIRTQQDLSRFGPLYLVHPWVDFLLDRQRTGVMAGTGTILEGNMDNVSPVSSQIAAELPPYPGSHSAEATLTAPSFTSTSRHWRLFGGGSSGLARRATTTSSRAPSLSEWPPERQSNALGLIARLSKPFGALLFASARSTNEGGEYRRVAAECLMTVQVDEVTPVVLDALIRSVQIVDVV